LASFFLTKSQASLNHDFATSFKYLDLGMYAQLCPLGKAKVHARTRKARGYQMASPRKAREEHLPTYGLALWYATKAKGHLQEGNKLFQGFRYPECVSAFGASIEFASKALCAFLGADYKTTHTLAKPLIYLSVKFPDKSKELSRAAWISSRWVGADQQTRLLASYGNQEAAVPATKFIIREDVELIKADAEEACSLLNTVETKQKFMVPIKLGMLNGHVDETDSSEKPCSKYTFSEFKIEDWEKRLSQISLSGRPKFEIEKIPISRVSNEFALIINPFGEVYPETDVKKRFAFNHLRNYVEEGGVLVNVAGFPFFYAWDVSKGAEEPVVDETTLVPDVVRTEGGKLYVDRFKLFLNFAGSLSWRELGVTTTGDTPQMAGVNELQVYQEESDKAIVGDIVNVGGENKVHEFRAVRKDATQGAIPLLRTQRPDFGEVFPIAAVNRGFGWLIVGGMHTKSTSELEKLVVTIDNFCSWLSRR
jgi:HEPN domain-containing protein